MFERDALIDVCLAHGRVVRVVVASVKGSAPREVGAAMLVWAGGQSGTIGGGMLEHALATQARVLEADRMSLHALGPDMGQCCGGAVEVLSEVYDLTRARALPTDVIARGPGEMPLNVRRILNQARSMGELPRAGLTAGWFVEAVAHPRRSIWIWGAGHVGRALVSVMHRLPDVAITWVDTALDRFPNETPEGVEVLPASEPQRMVPYAPRSAEHLIVTFSHALDLELCHGLLGHGFARCGLIGSKTKWARFQKRLRELGHTSEHVARITCPIGQPELGKHPQAIAIGVAQTFLASGLKASNDRTVRRG